MVQAINSVENKIYYNQKKFKTEDKNKFENHNSELVGYEVAKALLAKNNISFKNLSQPIEITHLYNKKTEGTDHLDLDNIHVYEFKDTNLKVFVTTEKDNPDKDFSYMYNPQIILKINNCYDENKKDIQVILEQIINKRIQNIDEDIAIIKENNNIRYCDFLSENPIKNTTKINEIIFNLKINETDLENLNDNYKNFAIEDLQKYYDEMKKNKNIEMFMIIQEKVFNKNKDNILKTLNKNINIQIPQNTSSKKDLIKEDLSLILLTSNERFNKNFTIEKNINLKNNYEIKPNNPEELKKILTEILESDIKSQLDYIKTEYKNNINNSLSEKNIHIIKGLFISKYGESIFNMQEIVDSITEDDVKNYIKQFFIEQPPIVETVGNNNNISFKNLSQPIEITHLYNKKTEDIDHLDLDNIHVYEFKDTNLRIFINEDVNVITDESTLNKPKIKMCLENNNFNKTSLLKEKILHLLIAEKNKNLICTPFSVSYENSYGENILDDIADFNTNLFNLEINENDLNRAKQELIKYLESYEYQNINKKNKSFYNVEDLLNENETKEFIAKINLEDMNKFYKEYLKESSYQAFITVSPEFFNENKNLLLRKLNSNIPNQILQKEINSNYKDFELNSESKIINNNNSQDIDALNYPIKNITSKDFILAGITKEVLNSDNKYQFEIEYFTPPLELKEGNTIKYNFTLYNVKNKNGETIEKKDYESYLKNIDYKELDEEIQVIKINLKKYFANIFKGDSLDLIKNWELYSYQDSLFELYEIIDDIKPEDIKDFVETYIINQAPFIEMKKEVEL